MTLNVSIENLDTSNNGHRQNGSKDLEHVGMVRQKRSDESVNSQPNKKVQPQSQNVHLQQEVNINRREESSPTQTSVVKHSLLQFALQHFRYE